MKDNERTAAFVKLWITVLKWNPTVKNKKSISTLQLFIAALEQENQRLLKWYGLQLPAPPKKDS